MKTKKAAANIIVAIFLFIISIPDSAKHEVPSALFFVASMFFSVRAIEHLFEEGK